MLTQTVSYLRSVDWRDLWHEPAVQMVLSLIGFTCLAPVLATFVPPMFQLLPQTYLVWMIAAVWVGFMVNARWWVVWLVGTLLWSLAWLVGCLWQISQMVGR